MGAVLRALAITLVTVAGWHAIARWHGPPVVTGKECAVSYVYDGDTVAIICGTGREETARIVGFDTPETTDPDCAEELAHGTLATERLRTLITRGPVDIRRAGYDRYGRVLVTLEAGGEDVARTLVREGLAVAYEGGARPDWCAQLRAL